RRHTRFSRDWSSDVCSSDLTDKSGAEGLRAALATLGHAAEIVETPKGVLHFKTDCSLLDEETVLATHRLAGSGFFRGLREIVTRSEERRVGNEGGPRGWARP